MGVVITIPAHGVASLPGEPLSCFQKELMEARADIVIGNAPTGSGKSFAFVHALVRPKGERADRILFIVPTIRLANNLAATFAEQIASLSRDMGEAWSSAAIKRHICVFTSEEAEKMKAEQKDVKRERWRMLSTANILAGLDDENRGEIVISTPESIATLLYSPLYGRDQDLGPGVLLSRFDRIVFDECHLLQPRGFAMLSILASMAKRAKTGAYVGDKLAQIMMLSATPLDVNSAFRAMDLKAIQINERITEDGSGRTIRGDVQIEFVEADSILDIMQAREEEIKAEIKAGNKVLGIYDSLVAMQSETRALKEWYKTLGFPEHIFIRDNSLDGQRKNAIDAGRQHALEDRGFIVSTSTVEVGVTLDNLSLMFMDAGRTPASFTQRLGRAGRRGKNAKIYVRLPKDISKFPWLGNLVNFLSSFENKRCSVLDFNAFLSNEASKISTLDEAEPLPETEFEMPAKSTYGRMTHRAVWCTAVHLALLEDKYRGRDGNNAIFWKNKPLFDAVSTPEQGNFGKMCSMISRKLWGLKRNHAEFYKAFANEALNLRDFPPTVEVRSEGGQKFQVSMPWLYANTDILQRYPLMDEEGAPFLDMKEDDWSDCVSRAKEAKKQLDRTGRTDDFPRQVAAPTGKNNLFVSSRSPVSQYLRMMSSMGKGDIKLHGAVEDMRTLVGLTGIVPYVDTRRNSGRGGQNVTTGTKSSIL